MSKNQSHPSGTFEISDGKQIRWQGESQGRELFAKLIGEGMLPHASTPMGLTITAHFDPAIATVVFIRVRCKVISTLRP